MDEAGVVNFNEHLDPNKFTRRKSVNLNQMGIC